MNLDLASKTDDADTVGGSSREITGKAQQAYCMLRWLRSALPRQISLVLYVLAALAVGFAHRPIGEASAADLSAYALPDGSLPYICSGKGDGRPAAKRGVCEACCLTSALGLPGSPVDYVVVELDVTSVRWTFAHDERGPRTELRGFLARGPPQA